MNDIYTNEQVKNIIDLEGLEYAICNYMDLDRIEDVKLKQMCKDAKNKLNEIEEYLNLKEE